MTVYLLRKMLSHLAVLLLVNTVYISLRHIGKPSSYIDYDIKMVKQQMQDVLISATTIGVSFGAFSFLLVFMIQWNQNILVVFAAFFISVGMTRQIISTALDAVTTNMNAFLSSWASTLHLLARDRQTSEWRLIQDRVEAILLGKTLEYNLPAKLYEVKPNSPQVYKYLDERKWELEYQHAITSEDHSCLAFAQHAIKQVRHKLQIYDQLIDVQGRTGAVNNVVLISIGTLIWLLS
jgi:hypothetical protein